MFSGVITVCFALVVTASTLFGPSRTEDILSAAAVAAFAAVVGSVRAAGARRIIVQIAALALAAFGTFEFLHLTLQLAVPIPGTLFAWHEVRLPMSIPLAAVYGIAAFSAYRARYRPAMGFHPRPLSYDVSKSDYVVAVRNLEEQLRNGLDRMDYQTDWRPMEYVPLDAEVEVRRNDRRAAKVVDLYEGLRQASDSRLFVVLGDPGSGKSVSLRKLARDLLAETRRAGRIPLYVNLKEWRPERPWTTERPPTSADLESFVLASLQRRLGLTTVSWTFIRNNFKRLLGAGRFFLILDSFDEVPQLLDATDAAWLIRALSDVATEIITGNADGRGVIASRLFRHPEITRAEYCVLDIRPLSDAKVSRLIDQQASPAIASSIKEAVFTGRADLAVAGRNPLLLTLLIEYVKNHNELPENQYAMFRSHMDRSVNEGLDNSEYRDLSAETIWEATERIAKAMFSEEAFGLEMPLSSLRAKLRAYDIDRIVGFLEHARLGRMGSPGSVFSFVHRRFNEFFLVQWLLEDPRRPRALAKTIPDEGRWRDALALYAEVADDGDASTLADYCVSQLVSLLIFESAPGDEMYLRSIHCLRFLVDAFRGRRQLLEAHQQQFATFVSKALRSADDILVRKNAVEAIGILHESDANEAVAYALVYGDSWVRETAFRACRYLPALSVAALAGVSRFFLSIPATKLIREYAQLKLVFSLSEAFRRFRIPLNARLAEAILAVVLPIALLFVAPVLLAVGVSFLAIRVVGAIALRTSSRGELIAFGSDGRIVSMFSLRCMLLVAIAQFCILTPLQSILLGVPVDILTIISFLSGQLSVGAQRAIGNGLPAQFFVLAILVVTVMPFASLLLLTGERRSKPTNNREWLMMALFAVGGIAIVSLLFRGADWALSHVKYGDWVLPALSVLPALLLALQFLSGVWRRFRDWLRFKRATRVLPTSRVEVAKMIRLFSSEYGRLCYTRWLALRGPEVEEAMKHPDDKWPGNRRPNYGNDEASALLAKLEERWLGLAR